jgi:hypothetical protein
VRGERTPEPRLFAYHTHVALRVPAENRHGWRSWFMLGTVAVVCTGVALVLVTWLVSFDLDGLLLALRAYVGTAFAR